MLGLVQGLNCYSSFAAGIFKVEKRKQTGKALVLDVHNLHVSFILSTLDSSHSRVNLVWGVIGQALQSAV